MGARFRHFQIQSVHSITSSRGEQQRGRRKTHKKSPVSLVFLPGKELYLRGSTFGKGGTSSFFKLHQIIPQGFAAAGMAELTQSFGPSGVSTGTGLGQGNSGSFYVEKHA